VGVINSERNFRCAPQIKYGKRIEICMRYC